MSEPNSRRDAPAAGARGGKKRPIGSRARRNAAHRACPQPGPGGLAARRPSPDRPPRARGARAQLPRDARRRAGRGGARGIGWVAAGVEEITGLRPRLSFSQRLPPRFLRRTDVAVAVRATPRAAGPARAPQGGIREAASVVTSRAAAQDLVRGDGSVRGDGAGGIPPGGAPDAANSGGERGATRATPQKGGPVSDSGKLMSDSGKRFGLRAPDRRV